MSVTRRTTEFSRLTIFDCINYFVLSLSCLAFLYPLLLTLYISLSDTNITKCRIILLPSAFTLDSYKFLFIDGRIIRYYINSIFYSAMAAFFFLVFTSLMAYPFLLKDLKGKKFLNLFMIITMFFNGGLIPYFFIINALGMMDNVWVMIIPGAIGAYNVIIFRTFFEGIPAEIRESAYIDGTGHYAVLFRVLLPMSKPLLATFALFCMVGKWNDFLTPLLFFRSENLMPVQMLLRKMLVLSEYKDSGNLDMQTVYFTVSSRTVKCAAVIITISPVMCVYPLLQKYFTKGILVGVLKA